MTSVQQQPADGGAVTLPASMQTLLDRCTEREVTSQERHILAHASPNVRCEALRIFFEMNDAAAAVDYVLTHGAAAAASPRSHTGTSGGHRSSRSSSTSTAAKTHAAAAAPTAAVVKAALQPLSTNALPGKPAAVTAPRGSAEEADWRSTVAALAIGGAPAARSPLAKAGARPRRVAAAAAARGESVCTLVTVSSMSSSSDGDDVDGDAQHRDDDVDVGEAGADMPPTITLRTRASPASTSTTASSAAPVVPSLALAAVLKRSSYSSCSVSSPNLSGVLSGAAAAAAPTTGTTAAAAEGRARTSVSPALSTRTTIAAGPTHHRAVSPSVMPPPGARRLPSPAAEAPLRHRATTPTSTAAAASKAATAAARPASPAPVPPADTARPSADDVAEAAPRKTVAAKPAHLYIDPTLHARTAAGAPGPAATTAATAPTAHHVAFTDATAMEVLDACRRRAAVYPGGEVELAYTELTGRHSSPSPSCAPPSCGAGTDWAALVAAARPPPPLPAHAVLAAAAVGGGAAGGGATAPGAAPLSAMRSPRTARRPAPATTPATPTPAKSASGTAAAAAASPGSPRTSSTKAPRTSSAKAPRTPRVSDAAKPPMAASSTKRDLRPAAAGAAAAAAAHVPPRTPRISFEDSSARKTGGSGGFGGGAGIARMTPRGSQRSGNGGGGGASPEKRGVAWDEATGTYITHPNQLRRQMSRNALTADAPASGGAAAVGAAGGATRQQQQQQPAAATAAAKPVAVCAAGTSALETPSTLRYNFSRTATVGHASGSPAFARTPTAAAAAAASFGRLCSSAAHLSGRHNTAATPDAMKTAAKPSSHGSCAKAESAAKRATALHTPRSARATAAGAASKKSATAAHTLAPPPVMTPIAPSPRVMEYQRLRSGFAVPAANVYCHGGEVIALQRQASHLHALQQAIAVSPDASPSKLHRTATAAGSAVRLERHYSMMHGGGVEVVEVVAPSPAHLRPPHAAALRTPRTARPPVIAHLSLPCRESDDASRTSARRHSAAGDGGVTEARGPVPAAQCGVFERLASNYYAVYTSATALQTATSPPPVTARTRTARRGQKSAGRRRNASAPAAGTHGRRAGLPRTAAVDAAATPFRDAWLSPREVDAEAEEVAAGPQSGTAPVPAAFARSNTSRYLTF